MESLFTSPYDETIAKLRKLPQDLSNTPWAKQGISREEWLEKFYQDFDEFEEELSIQHNIEMARAQKSLREFVFTD